MKWRRFAGSNGSRRANRRRAAASLAMAMLLMGGGASAGQYDGYAAAGGDDGVVIGDYQPGQERSVIVSDQADGAGAPCAGGGVMPMPEADAQDCNRYGFSPAVVNRCLGPACPRWVGQADVLLLWQGNVPVTPLLTLQDFPNPMTLNGSQLPYGLATGPRTAILFNVDQCHAIEANYFNAGNFAGNRAFAAPAGTQLAWAALGNYNLANIESGTASTAGRIQSFELNWRRSNGRSLTWLAGFRWIEWNDWFTMADNFDDGVNPPGTDTLSARSVNDLFGGQIGLDAVLLTLSDVVRFNGVAKAGVYGNPHASTTMTLNSSDPTRLPTTSYTATGSSTGFFGEVGINGTVRLTEHLFWRAGYNFFWIGGVATSLNQLSAFDMTVPSGALNIGGSVFLQGINTGIEAVW